MRKAGAARFNALNSARVRKRVRGRVSFRLRLPTAVTGFVSTHSQRIAIENSELRNARSRRMVASVTPPCFRALMWSARARRLMSASLSDPSVGRHALSFDL